MQQIVYAIFLTDTEFGNTNIRNINAMIHGVCNAMKDICAPRNPVKELFSVID